MSKKMTSKEGAPEDEDRVPRPIPVPWLKNNPKAGRWVSDGGTRGAGSLMFHRSTGGNLSAYFRHWTSNGKREDLPLGLYNENGQGGSTLKKLRIKAGELSLLYQSGVRDLRAHFEAEARAKVEAQEAAQAAQEAQEAARQREVEQRERFTLQRLCELYVAHLERQGKRSAPEVAGLFRRYLVEGAPELATTPAREVTRRDLTALIRTIREEGKERTGGLLRSCLLAAYNLAIQAEGDTQAPAELIAFEVESNPVLGIKTIPVRPSNRTLNQTELRAFLALLTNSLTDRALLLALLAGGQRPSQMIRATVRDFDPDTATLKLMDEKGRRATAREHAVPLAPRGAALCVELAQQAQAQRPDEQDPPLFVSHKGGSLVRETLSHRVAELSKAMDGAPFVMRDLRRTCETLLAGLGISRDVRAQLLSHGLSGVQAQHYDRHSYETEKRSALVRWEAFLTDLADGKETNNVVTLRRIKAK